MKDNKNERNASEQFSPEELIRKLKFQLSGEPSTPDPVPPQKTEETSRVDENPIAPEETPEDTQESDAAITVPTAVFEETPDTPAETTPVSGGEEPKPAEEETSFAIPADETPEPALSGAAADLPPLRLTEETEDAPASRSADPAADETAEPAAKGPALSLSFDEDEKSASEEDAFLAYIRAQVMQSEDDAASKPIRIPDLEEITVPAEDKAEPDGESGDGEDKFNFFANLEEKTAEEEPSASDAEDAEKPTIAFDLAALRSESRDPSDGPDPFDAPDFSAPDFSTVSFSPADADADETAPPAAAEAFASNKPNINMLIALGISVSEVENIYGKEVAEEFAEAKAKEGQLDSEEFASDSVYEYTAASQNEEVARYFKKEKTVSLVKLIASAAIFFLLFLYENLPLFGVRFSGWMSQAEFPLVHVMVDLQLVLIAAALAFEELIDGVTGLIKKTPDIRSFAFCATVLNVISSVVIACTKAAATARLSGFSAVFVLTICLLASYLKSRADADNFAVVSTTGLKACCFADNDESVAKEKSGLLKGARRGKPQGHLLRQRSLCGKLFQPDP